MNEDNPVAQIPDMPRCYALCEAMLKAFLSSDDYLAMTGLCYQLMDDLRQLNGSIPVRCGMMMVRHT